IAHAWRIRHLTAQILISAEGQEAAIGRSEFAAYNGIIAPVPGPERLDPAEQLIAKRRISVSRAGCCLAQSRPGPLAQSRPGPRQAAPMDKVQIFSLAELAQVFRNLRCRQFPLQ